jgi:hypothetical protein
MIGRAGMAELLGPADLDQQPARQVSVRIGSGASRFW